jgi:hypothetical protein
MLMAADLRWSHVEGFSGAACAVLTLRLMSASAAHCFCFACSRLVRGGTETGTSLLTGEGDAICGGENERRLHLFLMVL